ncbi:MAG: carboxypeptidase regulatory-like domain-containing protein [Candidatus Sungbacteria bacterium]|uniref:Carboxypeptidase regulatory-like domain-containing protein n=1 Tax=Candidatus Sungiibacteriota bacterium TaxID=2750080 RepID=A0A931WNW8_9BACT|nr:carboxypeptidase regulatory-like domain-containing protein [Candidatus Sungbacteria bacterium]
MRKYIQSLVILPLFVAPIFALAEDNNSATILQLQAQVTALQKQIEALRSTRANPALSAPGSSSGSASSAGNIGGLGGSVSAASINAAGAATSVAFDNSTANDDIAQLSNLRIQTISASSANEGIITAAYDFGVRCQKFSGKDAVSGVPVPCPLFNSQLYTIRVTSETQLFFRHRARAQLSDFAVGDRINVYGFMDRANLAIDALIVRNLDKPKQKSFIQLNNVEVVGLPAGGLPATLVVARKSPFPCFDYGTAGNSRATPLPCPLALESTSAQALPSSAEGSIAQHIAYKVMVSASTKIINRERVPMLLADISMGDKLNIYGTPTDSTGTIDALVIRDLSKPAETASRATIRAMAVNADLVCTQQDPGTSVGVLPCGLLYNATVRLYKNIALIAQRSTETGVAVFESVEPGLYTLEASAPGYQSEGSQSVVVEKGDYSVVLKLKTTASSSSTSAPTSTTAVNQ